MQTGAGSYNTNLSFNISKVLWWVTLHPMNFRVSLNYSLPALVGVKGFNAYGGGTGTDGRVHPGIPSKAILGMNTASRKNGSQLWILSMSITGKQRFPVIRDSRLQESQQRSEVLLTIS